MSPEKNGVRPVALHARPSVGDRATGERSTCNAQIWTASSSDVAATAPVLGLSMDGGRAGRAGVTRLPAAPIKIQPGQAGRRLGWG